MYSFLYTVVPWSSSLIPLRSGKQAVIDGIDEAFGLAEWSCIQALASVASGEQVLSAETLFLINMQ